MEISPNNQEQTDGHPVVKKILLIIIVLVSLLFISIISFSCYIISTKDFKESKFFDQRHKAEVAKCVEDVCHGGLLQCKDASEFCYGDIGRNPRDIANNLLFIVSAGLFIINLVFFIFSAVLMLKKNRDQALKFLLAGIIFMIVLSLFYFTFNFLFRSA